MEDTTHYIVPHGDPPMDNTMLILQNMLLQVSTFGKLLNCSEDPIYQWQSLTRRFPEMDDIVDRTCEVESLTSREMRESLIRLYKTYVSEWNIVESQISRDFVNQVIEQPVSQDVQMLIQ